MWISWAETLNEEDMKTMKLSALALGLMAALPVLNSCDTDSDDVDVRRPTALVTVYPGASSGFTMQLDDQTTLVPTNMTASPFGEKHVRALINYTEENATNGSIRNVHVNWIDSIRTKLPVETLGEDDEKKYGNDPFEIVRDWVTVAEDGFITLRIRTLWGGKATHVLNLVGGVNKDNVYEFDLRHNANGDTNGRTGDALIAFDLNSRWTELPDDVKIKINWLSFSGKKSVEFSLKMHGGSKTETAVEQAPMSRYVK